MISRRRTRLVVALLLPLMALRAMLPAGYMPMADSGTLRIVVCNDGLHHAAAADHGNHHGTTDHSTNGKHRMPTDTGRCPFASAAVNAAPPAISQLVFRIDSDAGVIPDAAVPVSTASIVRAQSARGPPSISL